MHVVFNEIEFPFKNGFLNTKQPESTIVMTYHHLFPILKNSKVMTTPNPSYSQPIHSSDTSSPQVSLGRNQTYVDPSTMQSQD